SILLCDAPSCNQSPFRSESCAKRAQSRSLPMNTTFGLLAALVLAVTVSSAHADGHRARLAQAPTVGSMCTETYSLPQCVGSHCVYLGSTDRVSGPTFPWGCRRAA